MSEFKTLYVEKFLITDNSEDVYFAEDDRSFEQTDELLHELRDKHVNRTYRMYALIDA